MPYGTVRWLACATRQADDTYKRAVLQQTSCAVQPTRGSFAPKIRQAMIQHCRSRSQVWEGHTSERSHSAWSEDRRRQNQKLLYSGDRAGATARQRHELKRGRHDDMQRATINCKSHMCVVCKGCMQLHRQQQWKQLNRQLHAGDAKQQAFRHHMLLSAHHSFGTPWGPCLHPIPHLRKVCTSYAPTQPRKRCSINTKYSKHTLLQTLLHLQLTFQPN